MKPGNNRRLIVIPALIRISSHDPAPHARQQSEWLNHITMRRVDELRVNVWLIRPRGRGNEGSQAARIHVPESEPHIYHHQDCMRLA